MGSGKKQDKQDPFRAVNAFLAANDGRERPVKPMPDVFRDFIAEASVMFPELSGKLVIWDSYAETAYGKDLDASLKQHFKSTFWDHDTRATHMENLDLYVIAVDASGAYDKQGRTVMPRDADKLMTRTLDHEIAHLLIRNLNAWHNYASDDEIPDQAVILSEAASDAYMLLREYQRNGTKGAFDDPRYSPAARADWMIRGGDTLHFTSFVTDAIINRKDKIDFSQLTPQQTLQVAEDFAVVYTATTEQAKTLCAAFNKLLPTQKGRLEWNDTLTALESVTYRHGPEERREKLEKAIRKDKLDDTGVKLARVLLNGKF